MALADDVLSLSGWLYLLVVVSTLLAAVLRKREPASALAWSLAILFIPVLGPVLFLLFGVRAPGRLIRKVRHIERFATRFSIPVDESTGADRQLFGEYEDGAWGDLGRMIERLDWTPRRTGNATELYTEGLRAFQEMSRAIESAQHHIHIEFYIFRYDVVGKKLVDLLCKKARQGVEVRLIADGMGTFSGWRVARLVRQAGGKSALFVPFPFSLRFISPNYRNHRKVIICDGEVAFFGGLNVGREYLGRAAGWRGKRASRDWYDLHMRVRGKAVWDLQRMFAQDWDYSSGELLDDLVYFPSVPDTGGSTVQVVFGGPATQPSPIRQAIFAAISLARESIYIASPYLVPDLALREALKNAAMSGVQVHIVTQAPPPDHFLTYHCGLYFTEELIAAGVHVYGYTPGMMHAKAYCIDERWAMIGTANLDNRSMFLNYEQMAVLDQPADASLIHSTLVSLVAVSDETTLEKLHARPWPLRLLASIARLLAPLL